jgi:hypothetical protein
MSRYNGERRKEDNARERAFCENAPVSELIGNGLLLDELVVGESTCADGNTVVKAGPAARRVAIGKVLLIPRMTSYAAFSAA